MKKIKLFFLLYPVYIVLLTIFCGLIGHNCLLGALMGVFTYPIFWGAYYSVASVTAPYIEEVQKEIKK